MAIKLLAQMNDGSWGVRNAFRDENTKLRTGQISREQMLTTVHQQLLAWQATENCPSLRIHDDELPAKRRAAIE